MAYAIVRASGETRAPSTREDPRVKRTIVLKVNVADEADCARLINLLHAAPGVEQRQWTEGAGIDARCSRACSP